MNSIAETGMAAFHFDSKNKPQESMDITRDRISLIGNINNPETLYAKEPDAVCAEVCANLDAGVHMVGPECAIPLQTSIENLLAIPRAVRDWHADHAHNQSRVAR
jgi:[methyl-Co(III) methanol-specific corrinoid protein]:coenzyme M methyltransferase